MNNDFERNSENLSVPDEQNAYAPKERPVPEEAHAPEEAASPVTDEHTSPAPQVESAEPTAGIPTQTSNTDVPNGISHVTYHPQSDTYSYQRTNGEPINGCAWDSSANAPHKVQTEKKSSRGFKVFAASMLTIFTVSAVAIASFMAMDYTQTAKEGAASDKVPYVNASTDTDDSAASQSNQTILISTFKDSGEGLTKAQVATKCGPSTVGIVVESQSNNSYYGFFGNYYSQPQIVQGVGSGFIYSKDGYIITNHHVVEDATKITVYLNDDTQVEATLIGSDELSDLAVIKIDATELDLIPMEIGDSDRLVVGDEVIAIGCPAGIQFRGTVTDGIISAINRNVELSDSSTSGKKTMTLLQTNATINKGNSGGPLINSKGQVIGINTLKLTSEYEGIGFAIPINGAVPIISQLIEYGKVTERPENDFVSGEGVIGISGSNISASESEYYDIPQGVLVVQINKDGSAAKAGLRRGDIITAYNGTPVKTITELNTLKAANKAGDEVTITVYRDSDEDLSNKTFDLTFKLDMA